jgi:hypothetical protein
LILDCPFGGTGHSIVFLSSQKNDLLKSNS